MSFSLFLPATLLPTLHSGPLHAILQGIVEGILRTPAAHQGTRAFLYGSLLYYLMMTRPGAESGDDEGERNGMYAEAIVWTQEVV